LLFVNAVQNSATVATLYNSAVVGKQVVFNDDDGTCPGSTCIAAGSHPSCTGSGSVSGLIAPVTSSFDQIVETATGGCCTANACVYAYVDTETIFATSGGTFSFQFGANAGGDWYEVAAILYSVPGPIIEDVKVFRGSVLVTGTDEFTIQSNGDYFIRFFAGSYDATGGGALGAILRVDSFRYSSE